MGKRSTANGWTKKKKPKEGDDRRHTGRRPGRPKKPKEEGDLVERPRCMTAREMLPRLLWGGPEAYRAALDAEAELYEQTGQLQRALELQSAAEQSTFRERGLGGESQAVRDKERAIAHCSEAAHAANMHFVPFSMAVRSIAQLSRRAQSKAAWAANSAITSHPTAYGIVEAMMQVRPEHRFAGRKDLFNAVIVYDQVFRSDGCFTKSGESRGKQRLNADGEAINVGSAARIWFRPGARPLVVGS